MSKGLIVNTSDINQPNSGITGSGGSFTINLPTAITSVSRVRVLNVRYRNLNNGNDDEFPIIVCSAVKPIKINNIDTSVLYIIEYPTTDTTYNCQTAHNNSVYLMELEDSYKTEIRSLSFQIQSSRDGSNIDLVTGGTDSIKIYLEFF